jgi:hypothetical protein
MGKRDTKSRDNISSKQVSINNETTVGVDSQRESGETLYKVITLRINRIECIQERHNEFGSKSVRQWNMM